MENIVAILGDDADELLTHQCKCIPKENIHSPGSDFIDRILIDSDRPVAVLRNMQALFSHGRLANTGYMSLLPVDQGVEHSGGASFAPNPLFS